MLLKPPLVSIIIPVYNREKFVTTALNSVKSQTFRDWELIIVDDGSSDNSVDRCLACLEGVANHYEIVRQDNAGAGAARATGIKHCSGSYIAFLDSDDEWHAHHLESCGSNTARLRMFQITTRSELIRHTDGLRCFVGFLQV